MIWLALDVVLAMHDELIAEHGGSAGLRDANVLESALARAQNLAAHHKPDLATLAAAYAFGIARNHAFIDGNKRTSLAATRTFLALNEADLIASDGDKVRVWSELGAGTLSEEALADWLRPRLKGP